MLGISGPLLPLLSLSLSHAQMRIQQFSHGAFHISKNTAQYLSRCQRDNGAVCRAREGGRGGGEDGQGRGAKGLRGARRAGAVCCLFLASASVHSKPQSHFLISVPPLFYSNLIPDHCFLFPTLN